MVTTAPYGSTAIRALQRAHRLRPAVHGHFDLFGFTGLQLPLVALRRNQYADVDAVQPHRRAAASRVSVMTVTPPRGSAVIVNRPGRGPRRPPSAARDGEAGVAGPAGPPPFAGEPSVSTVTVLPAFREAGPGTRLPAVGRGRPGRHFPPSRTSARRGRPPRPRRRTCRPSRRTCPVRPGRQPTARATGAATRPRRRWWSPRGAATALAGRRGPCGPSGNRAGRNGAWPVGCGPRRPPWHASARCGGRSAVPRPW